MARIGTRILDTGDTFPSLVLKMLDGPELHMPSGLKNPWNVVLFYRGSWCPYCKSQLRSFQIGLEKLTAEEIGVLAVSVDPLDKARSTQLETGATFPIAYDVPVKETAEAIGAFYDAAPTHTAPYLEATGFVLGPGGKILVSVYSSGAIGRLVWQDVLAFVQHAKAAKR